MTPGPGRKWVDNENPAKVGVLRKVRKKTKILRLKGGSQVVTRVGGYYRKVSIGGDYAMKKSSS